uniref:Isopenicillin N synthase-like Fe(2+) 2OG dioxygenase domain-containing protein n=1 Tax=Fibrocapsa japonica TaxID=94617 RepID=A0A7S2XZJ5_9STRA|mmetsp:Transcript_1600/g.2205  ORF Transcript_1600/g.2205 Transcript_1600/m.2205 type:complete len:325 (+) Transcript_1600:173-1147(+)|eukprot:CAMPEP_0113942786 /NCGR_PEP_ID=MMETSP1339-20121228/9622_1 /TAXON_ID=94617 /ORGANISM="Fibrocapsa japonica" /LENGTH=324 /DNA_ID=CAMNT_0000947401 /DNA_START=91 /DNA_END=1065 /DNA_ORIENTATION=+ /assembly_acc=CAM_ASM_000762
MFYPRRISASLSAAELAQAINDPQGKGVLLLTDLPKAPIPEIQSALDGLSRSPDITARLNNAYKKNLVYKDSFAAGKGGPKVDMKRVLDLSPERLEQIKKNDPNLAVIQEGSLAETLSYWENVRTSIAPKIVRAVADAVGTEDIVSDSAFNYRMVDYYERLADSDSAIAPRCGEHRDFGTFTLIFPSRSGFQVNVDGEWRDIPALEEGTAILLFGWCTQIRSNGRIPAALHRVSDVEGVPRRTSAVLFCAPKHADTALEPVVRAGEERVYVSGAKAGDLRGQMARKWQMREGTLSEEGRILEEKEILATNMLTQDDVVKTMAAN